MPDEYNPFGPGSREQLAKQWDDLEAEKQEALARRRAKKAELKWKYKKER